MAQELFFTATFEHVSGFTEDRVVNTFPIAWTGAGSAADADLDAAFNDLVRFYNVVATTDAVSEYLSKEISRAADSAMFRVYSLVGHLDGSGHGSPIRTSTFSPQAINGTDALPGECAVCLTTRANGWQTAQVETPDGADPGTAVDRPRQRLSGRVFLGPLQDTASALITNVVRVNSTFVTDILVAAERLADELVADGFQWMVWSRVNAAMEPITHLQVDNAFDTQRRRGADPSSRSTVTL